MSLVNKILYESLLKEEKIVGFENPNYGNFVVLMGSPGAGKTFAINNLLNLNNFKSLNSDNWLEIIAKREKIDLGVSDNVAELHGRLDRPFKKFRDNVIDTQKKHPKPQNLVIDVTGKNMKTLMQLAKTVEGTAYNTTLVYIMTSKDEALRRNNMRQRRVPEEIIMNAYEIIQANYTEAIRLFDNVWIKIGDDFWTPFQGEHTKDEQGHDVRKGTYNRVSNQILKVK